LILLKKTDFLVAHFVTSCVQAFIEKAFSNYTATDSKSDRSLTQIEALLEGHAYGRPVSMKDIALAMMESNPTSRGFLEVLSWRCCSLDAQRT
jgi:hypothetical protein